MRQFTYKYKSYMKNRHGFVNMIPHAKFLHPYMGFSGADANPVFRRLPYVDYSRSFCNTFLSSTMVFEHKVKLFFPEIKHGVIAVDSIKYSIDKEEETDDVTITYKLIESPKYKEYYVIDDFSVEFIIEISVDFGKRGSITAPVTVFCNFIDIYVHNQKISIITHDNNLVFIPYFMSYKTDFPPEVARLDTDFANIAVNSDLQYGFIVDGKSHGKLDKLGIKQSEINMELLNTKKRIMGVISDAGNDGGVYLNRESISAYSGVSKKYVFMLPQAIFPDKTTLHGLPVFDSEMCSSCCDHWGYVWDSAYFTQYEIPIPPKLYLPVPCPKTPVPCQEMAQYEIRNRVIDGYLIFADKSWAELDALGTAIKNSEKQRIDAASTYLEADL